MLSVGQNAELSIIFYRSSEEYQLLYFHHLQLFLKVNYVRSIGQAVIIGLYLAIIIRLGALEVVIHDNVKIGRKWLYEYNCTSVTS